MDAPLVGTQGNDSLTDSPQPLHGRRDSYRLLARRAVRLGESSRRHLSSLTRQAGRRPERARPAGRWPERARSAGRWPERARQADVAASRADLLVPAPLVLPGATPSAAVQIRCFGRFELSGVGGTVQHWRRRSAERLLKFLLVNGRRVHRDVLLEVLWPEAPNDSSIRGLRVTLHALRRAVAQVAPLDSPLDPPLDLVRAEGDTYVLNTRGVWIDADAFDEHYSAALRFERLHLVDAAVREYAAAEALYRDDFLIDDLYQEWTVLLREELKDKYLLVLTKLAQFSLATMDLDGCIRRSHALLAKEPCREDAYQRLMQCHMRLGQRASAVRWYQICERTLREELDVAPSDETRGVFREIAQAS